MNNAFSINLTLYNDFGHIFDNFTSVHADWSSNMPEISFEEDSSLFVPFDSTEQRRHVGETSLFISLRVQLCLVGCSYC